MPDRCAVQPYRPQPNLVVELRGMAETNTRIQLISAQGNLVFQQEVPANSNTVSLDVSHLQDGLYRLIIRSEKGAVTKQIMIKR